ncbi:MAG: uroporphyrinogen-III C-methyltransferase [Burkholderiaceae bacterium]|nr:uroporphyrinogen-III C-methyltransferase [Burkholderiaceae bacterium]
MSEHPVPEIPETPSTPESPANAALQGRPAMQAAPAAGPGMGVMAKVFAIFIIAALALSMLASVYLWRKLSNIQEHLARQSADATTASVEARAIAKNAQDVAREAAARVVVNEARLGEVALQRGQLDELMQSLSRSRDENLVVDIESALRLAQQQAQLTGSVEPLLAALKTADLRLARAAQPRLNAVRRALTHDTDRIKAATVTDIPGLLTKLDELTRLVDDLPVLNAVVTAPAIEKISVPGTQQVNQKKSKDEDAAALKASLSWQATWQKAWQTSWSAVRTELLKLVRVSRIEHPDAVLLSPEQTFFLRENLKLKLLNARLGLLSRQLQSAKADLASASVDLHKYADPTAKSTQVVFALLLQVQGQLGNMAIPGLDESLSALTLAATGR